MAKNLVFCADGTWNGPDRDPDDDYTPGKTNVQKLFEMLSGRPTPGFRPNGPEQEKAALDTHGLPVQHAKYLHGVGDSDNPLIGIMGGIAGAGLVGRIIRGYTYLSRNFRDGDHIFLAGFSRGAYTVRALAGMVASIGLLNAATLDLADKRRAYRYGITAWANYRRILIGSSKTLEAFADHGARVPNDGWLEGVRVRAVGAWDTVGSYGIPFYMPLSGRRLETIRFATHALDNKVEYAFHALAVDERRADFTPTLWDPRAGIEQVWFAGAHSDVGGGYPEDESLLSNIALPWMTRKLAKVGLRVDDDGSGLPQDATAPIQKPWLEMPWKLLPKYTRRIPKRSDPRLHASLYERKKALGRAYRPYGLRPYTVNGRLDPKYRE